MHYYYSCQTKGLYNSTLHGSRTLKVPDPNWVRPTKDVTLMPGESIMVGGEVVSNTGDEPITLHDVPDMDVEHPEIEVANPDCKIPEDAIEIEAQEFDALMKAQSEGCSIVADAGRPVAQAPVVSLPDYAAAKKTTINQARDAAVEAGVEYAGNRFDTDQKGRDNLTATIAAITAGVPLPDPFYWRSSDDVDIPLTATELTELGATVLAHVNACYQRSWQLKDAVDSVVENAVDVEAARAEIDAIVW